MSRIGKQPITIPANTDVTMSGHTLTIKGPHGTLSREVRPLVSVEVKDGKIICTPKNESIEARALWGTYASHIRNMVEGVNTPFVKKLVLEGVGYRVELKGNQLSMNLGFSHPVLITIPEDIIATVEKNIITISGADKDAVGQFAAEVRALKKPEPYKGKGMRYEDEVIQRKEGKKSA